MTRICAHCFTRGDGARCRYCGGPLLDDIRDDHARELVPHAVWGIAWWTPFLRWDQLEHWRRMNRRGED